MSHLDRREEFVRPPGSAREARAHWREVWPFRFLGLLVLLAIAYGGYLMVFSLHIVGGGNSQG